MPVLPEPRRRPEGGLWHQLTEVPSRVDPLHHRVEVSSTCDITLTCDESDGEYVAVDIHIAAPNGEPTEWGPLGVTALLEPSQGVLCDTWEFPGSKTLAYRPFKSAGATFEATFNGGEDFVHATSGLLALGYPRDVPFIVGHLALELVYLPDTDWWDCETEDGGGWDSPGLLHCVRIPIVVGGWSMPDVQQRFPHYQPTADRFWPMKYGDDTYYSGDPIAVMWVNGRYVVDC